MSVEIRNIVNQIKNPISGKTLKEEQRLNSCEFVNGELLIEYNRDGISPENKRKIEDAIIFSLNNIVDEEKITVKTVSNNSGDVLGQPQEKRQQEQASLKVGHGPAANKKRVPGVGKVIAVSSCKGGVGKSTVAVNLAISLKNSGKKVGILDADIYGPSLPTLLNQRDAKPQASEQKKIKPIETEGLKFISFGLFIPESDPVIWRGPMLGGVLNQFLFDVEWGELDYLIIDLPPGTGDMQLSLIQNTELDGALVVSTPQSIALLDTKKGLNMFKHVNIPILGMIENMSYFVPDDHDKKYFIFGEGGVASACKELEVELLGEIPIEIQLREASDNGKPYMATPEFEGRPVWKAYMEISKKLDNIVNGKEKSGFFNRIFGK